MKKILILVIACLLIFSGCKKEEEYDPQLEEFMTKLVSYSTYEEAGLRNIKKYNAVFQDYFTEEGYKAFIKAIYPSIYVEFTTKNKINRTEDIHIKKVKEEKTEESIILLYEVTYTFRGNRRPIKFTDEMQITLVQVDGVYKIKRFMLLNSSGIIQEMFYKVMIA